MDFIVTEDRDLLPFGSKVTFFKMDKQGNGEEIKRTDLQESGLFMKKWDVNQFVQICILSGCDYLQSPKGIGIETAIRLFHKHKTIEEIVEKSKFKFDKMYIQRFYQSFATFKFMTVYCPLATKSVSLNRITGSIFMLI